MCGPGGLALAVAWLLAVAPDGASSPHSIREDFVDEGFDRRLWNLANLPSGGQLDFEGDSLHIVVPPGGKERQPAAFAGRFGLEGDFSVRAEYRLEAWPPPPADWINIEIKVGGGDGYAAVIRTLHAKDGPAYVALSMPAVLGVSGGLWKATPTEARAGTLWLEREASHLRFWARDAGGKAQLLGETEFGLKAIDSLAFRVTVPATTGVVEARFDAIEVAAERIIAEPAPRSTLAWAWSRTGLAMAGLSAAVAAGWLLLRSARWTPAGESRSSPRPVAPPTRVGLAGLAIVCAIVGLVARADGFDDKSLWGDEVATARRVARPTLGSMLDSVRRSPFPPAYYLAARGWVSIWGEGDAPIRALSASIGVLTIPVTLTIWLPLLGRRAGLWAVALLSLNAFHILYSADAKMYTAVWLLATISSGAMLHLLLRSPGRMTWMVAYLISSACLPMVSYVGAAPLAAQALFAVFWPAGDLSRPRCKNLEILAIAALIAAIPSAIWLPNAIRVIADRTGIDWIPDADRTGALAGLYQLTAALFTGAVPPGHTRLPSRWSWWLVVAQAVCIAIAAFLATVGISAAFRGRGDAPVVDVSAEARVNPRHVVVTFLAVWASAPTLGVLGFSYAAFSLWGVPRYLAGAMPAAILLVSAGLGSMDRRRVSFALGSALLAVNIGVVWIDRQGITRYPWREIARAAAGASSALELLAPGEGRSLIVAWPGEDPFDEACLRHALETQGQSGSRVFFMPLEDAVKSGVPFLVLTTSIGVTPGGEPPIEPGPLPDGYSSRPIFEATVLGQRYTPILDLFSRDVIRLWACAQTRNPAG